MSRFAAAVVLAVLVAGCRAPIPSFNPWGPTRIPPPGTGAVQAPGTYYQRQTQPLPNNGGTGFRSLDPKTSAIGVDPSSGAAIGSGVGDDGSRLVSANSIDQVGPTGNSLRFRNVTTAAAPSTEPGQFTPPSRMIDISELPRPATIARPPIARNVTRASFEQPATSTASTASWTAR